MKRLIKKSILRKQSYHDDFCRDSAVVYINGQILFDKNHTRALNEYLYKDVESTGQPLHLPDYSFAFLNYVNDEGFYIIEDSLDKITIEELILKIKEKYPQDNIYLDNSYNEKGGTPNNYTKVATIKRRLIKKARLPIISDYYNVLDFDFVDIGIQTVSVNDIIGMTDSRVEDYNDDWTPKNPNDSRWIYQKDLVEQGGEMEVIPLTKTPDGKYYPGGDGNHRCSVAKVLGLSTVRANVSAMVPKAEGVNDAWEEHAKDKIDKLNEMSTRYRGMFKEFNDLQDEAFETKKYDKYRTFQKEMNELGNQISQLDRELIEEENSFKQEIMQRY